MYKVYLALGRNQICKQKGQVLDTDHIGIYLVNSTTLQLETTTLSIYYMYIQFTFGYQKNISEILFKVALNTKTVTQKNILSLSIHWTTCLIYSGTCLIWHTKGPGKCVGLYRMSEYSGFILVNRTTLGPYIFVGCHRMSDCSGSKDTILSGLNLCYSCSVLGHISIPWG